MKYLSRIVLTSIIVFLYAQEAGVYGQLSDVPSSREEFGKKKVLRFEFTDIAKTKYKSKELNGKVIVIDCWASWCKPCQKALPELSKIKQKYHDKVWVLGISFDESVKAVKNYLQNDELGRGIDYPIVFGPQLTRFWDDVRVLPTIFLIDKEGHLRCRYRGYTAFNQLETDIDKLLAEDDHG